MPPENGAQTIRGDNATPLRAPLRAGRSREVGFEPDDSPHGATERFGSQCS